MYRLFLRTNAVSIFLALGMGLYVASVPAMAQDAWTSVTVGQQTSERVHPLNVPFVESQLKRVDDIQSRLAVLRDLQTRRAPQAVHRASQQVDELAAQLEVDRDPQVADLRRSIARIEQEILAHESELASDPASFTRFAQFLERDRVQDELTQLRRELSVQESKLRRRIRDVVAQDPKGAARVREVWDAEIELDRVTRERFNVQVQRDRTIRAAGNAINAFQAGEAPADHLPRLSLEVAPPHDADERMARFEKRNSPAAVRELGQRFFAQIYLDHPGLEDVAALVTQEDYAAALDAYKRFFFRRALDALGPSEGDPTFDDEREEGDAEAEAIMARPPAAVRPPRPAEVEAALSGDFTFTLAIGQPPNRRDTLVTLNPGRPGLINWALPEYAPEGDDATRHALDVFAHRISGAGQLGRVLLDAYVMDGQRDYLLRWADIADDWSMNWGRDIDNALSMVRHYNILIGYQHISLVAQLRNSAKLRPDFVEDLPATTLARLLLGANAEYMTSAIRLMRSGQYDFRVMMVNGMVPHALSLQEFRLHRWAAREVTRIAELGLVHNIRRDGANANLLNAGHENTDGLLVNPMRALAQAEVPWLAPWWEEEFTLNLSTYTRYWIHFLKQNGRAFRISTSPLDTHFARGGSIHIGLIDHEPEVQARMWKVFDQATPYSDDEAPRKLSTARIKGDSTPEPRIRSESMAFAGYYMLRSGWERSDFLFYLHSINAPVASGRDDHNGFLLDGNDHRYVSAPPFYVDDRIQYAGAHLPPWSGAKGTFSLAARPDKVQPNRFHTSDHFDFAEGYFDGPYVYHPEHRREAFSDIFGSFGMLRRHRQLRRAAERVGETFDDSHLTDVVHRRQVISLVGRDLYIVTDFVDTPSPRAYDQFYAFNPLVRKEHGARRVELLKADDHQPLRVDEQARTIQLRSPGLLAMDVQHFANLPLRYRTDQAYEREISFKKRPPEAPRVFGQHVHVAFKASGPFTLTTLMAPSRTYYAEEPASPFRQVRALEGGEGFSGFEGLLADGSAVFYAASHTPTRFKAGNLVVEGRALLRVGDRGILLDATRVEWGGRPIVLDHPHVEFLIEHDAFRVVEAIHQPIAPVVIEPAVARIAAPIVVTLSCPTPGVEIRYTTDGSDPSPTSARYTGPFTVSETTWVKARAFREGVEQTPWVQDGTHATVMSWAVYERVPLAPAREVQATQPGLRYEYFEEIWPVMLAEGPSIPALRTGVVKKALELPPRGRKVPFGIRYEGFLDVPRDGVYTFHAPSEFMLPDNESGYDLRVYVNGEEWYPVSRWHAQGTWSVALAKGHHEFKLLFIDMRRSTHRTEMQWDFPKPDFVWQGRVPDLRLSGPGMDPQPIPAHWLTSLAW